jgi:GAF domain-containing protein/HAMP domain-containing protein
VTTAVDTRTPAGAAATAGGPAPKVGPRRRLFAKYAAALVGLVSLVLLANGLLNVWFSYGEARDAAVRLQREKADAAAQHIEEFIAEIEKQIGWTTATQWASSPIDQRRFDFGRLQRQVPAITELIQLDGQGHEQLEVSRLKMDVVGSGADYSADPRFKEALVKKVWFGPVYFRKESEPYMTMAVAQSGRNAGVTAAEVNLKLIWDVITAIKIGKTGYAYVVDGDGRLIAHPDISRVLRNTDLSALPQVEAARRPAGTGDEPAAIVRNLDGHRVLSASAPIPKLGWLVFVEQPITEALAPLYTTLLNTGLLLLLGLAVAILAGLLLARRMTGPIRELDAGAARIGAGALGHRITVNTGDELEELAQRFNTMAADLQSSYADLEKKVEDRTAELTEALDQQTATAEVLRVINSSPGDLAPVFEAVLDKAISLCDAAFGILWTCDGEYFYPVAAHRVPEAFADFLHEHQGQGFRGDIRSSGGLGAMLRGEPFMLLRDAADAELYRSGKGGALNRAFVELGGARSGLIVPLRKDATLLGAIRLFRQEIRPFSDKQIALLQNFAAQAVIAMENARLITETREALEQQTATAEVLGVINGSPGDLAPVFDTMLEKAIRLCDGVNGILWTLDGERARLVGSHGNSPEIVESLRRQGESGEHPLLRRIIGGEHLFQFNLAEHEAFRSGEVAVAGDVVAGGVRTVIWVALVKDGAAVGAFVISRLEVRPFSEREIALLENFAAQAVIAMENARLITQTREALDQQTATAEVLQVINSSPGDLAPVFDAMLEKAVRLCEADFGLMQTYDAEAFHTMAHHNLPPQFVEFLRAPFRPAPGMASERIVRGEDVVTFADIAADSVYTTSNTLGSRLVELTGARSHLVVALRKDGVLLGEIVVYRREVRPFTDKQIALLQNFAAQAVIAMENARLITETREALEQQTATAEVLQVINSSPGDLGPVFDAMLEKAHSLCGAVNGVLVLRDGENFRAVAARGLPEGFAERLRRGFPCTGNPVAEPLLAGAPFVQLDDISRIDHPVARAGAAAGLRTLMAVALRKDGALPGWIVAARREVRAFSDKEIALLQNFAAQAVIAMENARLITETREALEQQTATAEVLGVINSSPGDLAPVFDAMLEKALRLCEVAFGVLWTYDGSRFRATALRGVPKAFAEFLRKPLGPFHSGSGLARVLHGESLVIVQDMATEEIYRVGDPLRRAIVDLGGARSALTVSLRKDETLLGAITAFRQEVRPFSDKQIALLQNFAAQAVIAMENARLLDELRGRTHDLQESLEYQTATSDVLKVISQSGAELEPVLDTLVETAALICQADEALIMRLQDGFYRMAASFGYTPEFVELMARSRLPPDRETVTGQTALERRVIHIHDTAAKPDYRPPPLQAGEHRTALGVPLLRDDIAIGVIFLARSRVEPFTEKQIALVATFADQAVIAIENARLLRDLQGRTRDLQESLEYQTATSDVLKVISQSGADLEPVLQRLVESAARICNADKAVLQQLRDGLFRIAASFGLPQEWKEFRARHPIAPDRGTPIGRMALERKVVHVEDALTDPEYTDAESRNLGEFRTMLAVPLFREGTVIGGLFLARSHVEPFTQKQIALVTTFADQAVIAIENARLFDELRARTTELGSSVAELKMLNDVAQAVSSTLDLRSVLSTILTSSLGVTWANAGAVFRYSRAERAFRLVEAVGWDETLLRSVGDLRLAETETAMGEAVARRMPVQLANTEKRASNPLRDLTLAAGYHSALIVPLLGAERTFGAITLFRQEAGEFPAETVRVMQTLASQSVLAIQNARLFREIADKSEQLALASQHKSQFLANMSHELRTPLNAILGYAELLVDGIYGALPDRPKGVLERIQNNGKHLLALINDVLDLAKIEAGQLTLTLENYALAEVVRTVVTATEPLATSKGLNFTATLQDDMPMGHGDARRVSQVLLNLVGNAIKFTEVGEIEISASSANGQFVLNVRDTGPGIPDADQERIFGEFQQIDNSNTRNKGGTGLGLAISKRMVELQGGTIAVESVLGQGSTFRVVLPVHVDEMMEAAE